MFVRSRPAPTAHWCAVPLVDRIPLHLHRPLFAWNEILYKGVVDYQIIPHLDFLYPYGFKGNAGISFTFSLNF